MTQTMQPTAPLLNLGMSHWTHDDGEWVRDDGMLVRPLVVPSGVHIALLGWEVVFPVAWIADRACPNGSPHLATVLRYVDRNWPMSPWLMRDTADKPGWHTH